MSETNKVIMDDSSLVVTVTVGQLKALVRGEVQAAIGQNNGHGSQDPSPALLTVDELAALLKVKKSHIYDLTRNKKDPIPHIRIGRYPRFEFFKVLPWFEQRKKH